MMFPPLLAYLEGKNTTEFLASLEILPSDYCIITYPEEETKNVSSQRRLLKQPSTKDTVLDFMQPAFENCIKSEICKKYSPLFLVHESDDSSRIIISISLGKTIICLHS